MRAKAPARSKVCLDFEWNLIGIKSGRGIRDENAKRMLKNP